MREMKIEGYTRIDFLKFWSNPPHFNFNQTQESGLLPKIVNQFTFVN